jgi:DNA (cytosine-5)-methyltransferase 1
MTHGSLFSGIGGFDLAAEWIGWENVFHCEIKEWNRQRLKKNFPNAESYNNILTFDAKRYENTIDVISGRFPCQDLSIANRYNGGGKGIKGERSGLWKEYARVIRQVGPGIIVFENSPMLLSGGLETVLCDLHELGYDAEWRCFYASDFGFPHFRKRVYGVAYSRLKRWKNIIKNGGVLQKVLPQQSSRQNIIPMSFERFNSKTIREDLCLNDGFSRELDRDVIYAYGNAVLPQIPYQIFKSIESYNKLEL